MLFLAVSLFFTNPAPLEMPRAEPYLVKENDKYSLEDRFYQLDLWVSQTVDGRWIDDDGRIFTLSTLRYRPPVEAVTNSTVTRAEYESSRLPLDYKRDIDHFRRALSLLSPIAPTIKARPPRQMPRGFRDVDYYQGTNRLAIVCAFLCDDERDADGKVDWHLPRVWRLASWELVEGDDYEEALDHFEDEFLSDFHQQPNIVAKDKSERELLRRDARHSVAAYDDWRVTDADEFSVLDDLNINGEFIVTLTNDLKRMRAEYAKTLPTGINGSNTLAVARIYNSRYEYLDALEADGITNMDWSAAYWSTSRRELVAYLPQDGSEELLKTIRHEALHQYLSYATATITVSPWLNEGYAQYFEEAKLPDWSPEELKRCKDFISLLMMMDYWQFYSGTDEDRLLKYRLALSLVDFIEHGASQVRFDPFKNLKTDYFKTLFQEKDMRIATSSCIGSADNMKLFQAEWYKYMLNRKTWSDWRGSNPRPQH